MLKEINIKEVFYETLNSYPILSVTKILTQISNDFFQKVNDADSLKNDFCSDWVVIVLTQLYSRLLINSLVPHSRDLIPRLHALKAVNGFREFDIEHLITLYRDPQEIARYVTPQKDFAEGEEPIIIHIREYLKKYIRENATEVVSSALSGREELQKNKKNTSPNFFYTNKFQGIANMNKSDADNIVLYIINHADQESQQPKTCNLQ